MKLNYQRKVDSIKHRLISIPKNKYKITKHQIFKKLLKTKITLNQKKPGPVWLSWLERRPGIQSCRFDPWSGHVADSIFSLGTGRHPHPGASPCSRHIWEATKGCFSLTLVFLPLPFSFSNDNEKVSWGRIKTYNNNNNLNQKKTERIIWELSGYLNKNDQFKKSRYLFFIPKAAALK